jgi:hypothetical protein
LPRLSGRRSLASARLPERARKGHSNRPAELDRHNVRADQLPFFFAKALKPVAHGLAASFGAVKNGVDPLLWNGGFARRRDWALWFHRVPYKVHNFPAGCKTKGSDAMGEEVRSALQQNVLFNRRRGRPLDRST